MKAITLATLSALALAGAACSDSEPQNIETAAAETAEVVPASAPANSGFNLPDPIASAPGSSSNSGFNLGPPPSTTPAPAGSGFNLPDTAPSEGALDTVPEFEAPPILDEPAVDEDEIIRLDP